MTVYPRAADPGWLLLGMAIPRAIGPLVVLMLLFLAGGVLAATQAKDFSTQPIYYAVTGFLAFSSCFFACLIAEDARRLDMIVNAWIAAALVTTGARRARLFRADRRALRQIRPRHRRLPGSERFWAIPDLPVRRAGAPRADPPARRGAALRRTRAGDLHRHFSLLLARGLGPDRRRHIADRHAALRDRAERQGARALPRARRGRCRLHRRAGRRGALDPGRVRTLRRTARSSSRSTTPAISAASSATRSAST